MIVAQLPVSVALLDRQLCFLTVSGRWRSEHSAECIDWLGEDLNALARALPASWPRACARALAGEEQHHPGESWPRTNGGARYARWWTAPWRGGHGEILGVMLCVEDVTAERERARELATLQRRTQHFARLGSDLFWEIDEDLRFSQISALDAPEFWEASGPMLGHHPWMLADDDARDSASASQRAVFEAHLPFRDHLMSRTTPAGARQWLSWNGDPCFDEAGQFSGYIGTIRDVTARQTMLSRIRESELRLSLALRASGDGLWDIDLISEEAYFAAGFAAMLGYRSEELASTLQTFKDLLHPDDREATMAVVRGLVERGGETFETQFRMHHRSGRWRQIRCRGILSTCGTRLVGVNADVTDREDALQREQLASLIFGQVQHGMAITDNAGRILAANQAFSEIMEYENATLVGTSVRTILAPAPTHPQPGLWDTVMVSADPWEGEVWHTRKSGEVFQDWMTVNVLLDDQQRPSRWVFLLTDLSRMKHARSELEIMAYQDPLTGLANRRQLDARLSYCLAHARREEQAFALVLLDLDGFKQVNDQLGHPAGDELLVAIARRLKALLREVDVVARLGGDEFVLILERADLEGARRVADKILDVVAKSLDLSTGPRASVTASLGVACYPGDGEDSSSLLAAADRRMYLAKKQGRARAVFDDRPDDSPPTVL